VLPNFLQATVADMRNADKTRIAEHLSPGEEILADARAKLSVRGICLVLTDRRILVLEENEWSRVTTKVLLDPISLDEVFAVETITKHPVVALGFPVFVVRLLVGGGTSSRWPRLVSVAQIDDCDTSWSDWVSSGRG
jgi:hypothetical protein